MASKIIGQNQVHDSTDAGFFKDQQSITENLHKASETGDDVEVGLPFDKFQFVSKYLDENRNHSIP